MLIFPVIKNILKHPLNKNNKLSALWRFVKWQINTRLNPYPIIYPFTEKSKLIVGKGIAAATGNFYCGLMEFQDMSFLLHFLRSGDLFIDIGANVGSFTVLASAHAGATTIAIEPVPATFKLLMNTVFANQVHDIVTSHNIALGSAKGQIEFTDVKGAANHVATKEDKNTIKVNVDVLDHLLVEKNPLLVKIDVEGFETEVLEGAKETLKKESLKAIIIELNGLGSRYGYDEAKIHASLLEHGFVPYLYHPYDRKFEKVETFGTHNTIYIRDFSMVTERVSNALKFEVFGKYI